MRITKIILLVLIISTQIFPQTNKVNPPYVTIAGGIFSSFYSLLDKTSDQNTVFIPRVGFGFPINDKMSLTGKFGYFSKNSIRSVIVLPGIKLQFDNSGFANLRQQLFNAGTNYTIELLENTSGSLNLGLAYSIIRIDILDDIGYSFALKNNTTGFYIGFAIEQEFSNFPISFFIDSEYSSITENTKFPKGQCGGYSFLIGAKYLIQMF